MSIIQHDLRGPTMSDAVREFAAPGPLPASTIAKAVKIRGFVCPYGSVNCYGESMGPGAFDEFLARLEDMGNTRGGYALPMHIGHDLSIFVGAWTRLWTTSEGLWAEGYLDKAALPYVKEYGLNDLSMSWLVPATADDDRAPCTIERWAEAKADGRYVPKHAKLVRTINKTDGVAMGEISLVDRGAFEGTHWEIIGGK